MQTLTNEGLDSEKSEDKIKVEVKRQGRKPEGKLKSDVATAKELSEFLELKRADPRVIELREITANRSSVESLETSSVTGKSKDNKSNPLLHKLQDRKLSVSQQTLTNVRIDFFLCSATDL